VYDIVAIFLNGFSVLNEVTIVQPKLNYGALFMHLATLERLRSSRNDDGRAPLDVILLCHAE
jgi:hypothetical protein